MTDKTYDEKIDVLLKLLPESFTYMNGPELLETSMEVMCIYRKGKGIDDSDISRIDELYTKYTSEHGALYQRLTQEYGRYYQELVRDEKVLYEEFSRWPVEDSRIKDKYFSNYLVKAKSIEYIEKLPTDSMQALACIRDVSDVLKQVHELLEMCRSWDRDE